MLQRMVLPSSETLAAPLSVVGVPFTTKPLPISSTTLAFLQAVVIVPAMVTNTSFRPATSFSLRTAKNLPVSLAQPRSTCSPSSPALSATE